MVYVLTLLSSIKINIFFSLDILAAAASLDFTCDFSNYI